MVSRKVTKMNSNNDFFQYNKKSLLLHCIRNMTFHATLLLCFLYYIKSGIYTIGTYTNASCIPQICPRHIPHILHLIFLRNSKSMHMYFKESLIGFLVRPIEKSYFKIKQHRDPFENWYPSVCPLKCPDFQRSFEIPGLIRPWYTTARESFMRHWALNVARRKRMACICSPDRWYGERRELFGRGWRS